MTTFYVTTLGGSVVFDIETLRNEREMILKSRIATIRFMAEDTYQTDPRPINRPIAS